MIVLPWPDKKLSPNYRSRSHWPVTAAKKAAREAAHILTTISIPLSDKKAIAAGEGSIPMTVTFYPPDKRHRDDDNMVGSFKSLRDGIADALGVNDRRFRPHYIFAEPEKPGRIEVVLPVDNSHESRTLPCDSAMQSAGREDACNVAPGPDHTLDRSVG